MADFEVKMAPVNITGPGVVHSNGRDLVHIPERMTAHIEGLPWHVTLEIGIRAGDDPVPEIVDLHVTQKDGGLPVSADAIRNLKLGQITDEMVRLGSTRWVPSAVGAWSLDFDAVGKYRSEEATKRIHRRVTEKDLRDAAEAYRRAKANHARNPLVLVADACKTSRPTAARWVKRAREEGFLDLDQ